MANNNKRVFAAAIVIVFCVTLIVYANLNDTSKVVKEFAIENASLLPDDVYRTLALKELKPEQLKNGDELQKFLLRQPYVKKCAVVYTGPNQVKVKIEEKTVVARVFTDDTKYLLTNTGDLIEEQQGTAALNLPLIWGISYANKILLQDEKNKLSDALTILAAFDQVDQSLTKEISEIVWLKGNQPAILLRDYTAPFLVTIKSIQRQVVYLQSLLAEKQRFQNQIASAFYVDMRFEKHIFLGNENNPENK
jgi:cell division septal protein FtsQ